MNRNIVLVFGYSERSFFEIYEPILNAGGKVRYIGVTNANKGHFLIRPRVVFLVLFVLAALSCRFGCKSITLVVESGGVPLILSAAIKKCCGIRTVYRMRGDLLYERNIWAEHNALKKAYVSAIRKCLSSVDLTIFCSKWLKDRYPHIPGVVVYNTTDLSAVSTNIHKPRKDIDLLFATNFLIDAKCKPTVNFIEKNKVRIRSLNMNVVVLGHGSLPIKVIKDWSNHGITFAGKTDNIADYYRRTKIFCHFSNLDAFPLVVIEAMLNSLPVIASNCCGMLEQLDSTTGISLDSSSSCCLPIILELLQDEEKMAKMGCRGYEKAIRLCSASSIGTSFRRYIKC